MSQIDVYNQEAKAVKKVELSDAVFGINRISRQSMTLFLLILQD